MVGTLPSARASFLPDKDGKADAGLRQRIHLCADVARQLLVADRILNLSFCATPKVVGKLRLTSASVGQRIIRTLRTLCKNLFSTLLHTK